MSDQNKLRSDRAHGALAHYKADLLEESGPVYVDDLIDLLADLRHYCAESGINFDDAAKLAFAHFEAERMSEV